MKNFKTDLNADINGTYKRGIVVATYDDLINAFGQPLPGDGEHVRAEWVVVFTTDDDQETVATIYDWCEDSPLAQTLTWNVGGHCFEVLEMVEDAISFARDMRYEDQNRMYQWDFEWAEEHQRLQ